MSEELSKLQAALLNVLKNSDSWMSRKDIAGALGRKSLSYHDIQQLKALEGLGLIESREATIGAVLTAYEYKAK
jgi:repressor of nif and glnA expression